MLLHEYSEQTLHYMLTAGKVNLYTKNHAAFEANDFMLSDTSTAKLVPNTNGK